MTHKFFEPVQLPADAASALHATTKQQVDAGLALRAPLASPALTGVPTAPTATVATSTTQLATTAFVVAQVAADAPTKTGGGASGSWGISITGSAATLTTPRNINGVAFNGSANITITANVPNALTFNNGGAGAASGSTFNGGAAVTISYNSVGAAPLSHTHAAGDINSGTFADARIAASNVTQHQAALSIALSQVTGKTTVGTNLVGLTNPSAITFIRINADNTVTALSDSAFRTAIGAGTSSTVGTVTSVGGTGTVSGLTLTGSVSSSGNLTLGGTLAVLASNFASQAANTALIAPNGSSGVPTFRILELSDILDAWTLKSARVATTANITLSGTQTIDTVAVVADDRVLVKNQSTPAQNGVYVVAAGAWTRAADASTAARIAGGTINVDSGTQGGLLFKTSFKSTDTLGTTAMVWSQVIDASMASASVGSTPGSAAAGTSLSYARADHVHPLQTSVSGNAGTATALATGRTIALTGVMTATGVNFDGTANISLTTAIADAALSIAKTSGLQAALDAKLAISSLTTVGTNLTSLANPSAIRFLRINADNTVSALDAATFLAAIGGSGGSGTVSSVSVVTANGVSGSVATATTTPAITLTLGAITPTSVAASGTVTGSNLSGTNTGDQTTITGNAGTATALLNARTIAISGPITGTATSFNGTANITIPVTALDVGHANVTGTLGVAHGGTGKTSITSGSFLKGAAANTYVERTPTEVRLDIAAKTHTYSPTAPVSPNPGDEWTDTGTTGGTFTWYHDGSSGQWIETGSGGTIGGSPNPIGLQETFETVSRNLKSYSAVLNYTGDVLTSMVYTVPAVGTITKTLSYSSGRLVAVILSGDTPLGITLTKALTYTGDALTGIAYS